MHVDTDQLRQIREIKAETMPLIVGTPVRDDQSFDLKEPPEQVIEARLSTLDDLPDAKPRRKVPWAELAFAFSEGSLHDSTYVLHHPLALVTIYAFEQFTDNIGIDTPLSYGFGDLISMPDSMRDQLFEHTEIDHDDFQLSKVEALAETFRRATAAQTNHIFVEQAYDTLDESITDGVPKAFWKQPDEALEDELHDENESACDDRGAVDLNDFM